MGKSLLLKAITILYDGVMKTLVTLLIACCFGSAMAQSNLPECRGAVSSWNNCSGTKTFTDGGKYRGAFKDGRYNGKGIYTFASGDKYVGEFKDGLPNGQGSETGIPPN